MAVTQHFYEVAGWGTGEVWVRDGVLVHHELAGTIGEPLPALSTAAKSGRGDSTERPGFPPKGGCASPTGTLARTSSREGADFVSDLCRLFERHLAGAATAYGHVPVDDSWCTPFQRELLLALRAVPWGELVSYGELAALAGRPGAARAAGSFCAENRFSLVVPCHRVVASDGIGGYGMSGVALKRRLLALEGLSP